MSSAAPLYTPYPYVNEAIQLLLENVQVVLGDYFYGLYLYGSLAGGDFDPGHSDIDCLIVTTKELPKEIIPKLEAMHQRIKASGLEWAEKIECANIPITSLYRYNATDPPRPHFYEGKFSVIRHDRDWVINRHILRESGVAVAGPPIRPLIALVTPDEIRDVIASGLCKYWPALLDKRDWLVPSGHQSYIVLTCCRALYTLKYGEIKSKQVSAQWALKASGKRWQNLIENALVWHYGIPYGDIEKTLQMMKYTLGKAEAYRARLPDSL